MFLFFQVFLVKDTNFQFVLAVVYYLLYNVFWKRSVYTMSVMKAVILAAGAGTRMKSDQPKVIHKVLDRTMLDYVIEAAYQAGASEICVIVGHGRDAVMHTIKHPVSFVVQEEQLGTGHAVMQAQEFIQGEGNVLVLFGDTPLITGESLSKLKTIHEEGRHGVTVLTTRVDDPTGYGRIIRDEQGHFLKSVEHKDAEQDERKVNEINSGMYMFKAEALSKALGQITNDNVQGEYYLPDTLSFIREDGYPVEAMELDDYTETLGVNNKVQLFEATSIMRKRINYKHMESGVTMVDANQVYIGKDVIVEADVIIYPGTSIEGKSVIKAGTHIGPNSKVIDSVIESNATIEQSTVLSSHIGEHTTVGPYAYIRPNSEIGSHVKVGDFVEIKNATIGDGTKISHLTYVGDADVGKGVNFGCGTVTVNYDGVNKHRTTIKDHAFIGCNTNLVSPVTIEENAYTAAGSTITKNVPHDALGIARTRQENKIDWVKKKRH